MRSSLLALAISAVAAVALTAAPARAHHEAIFGPHSSLMLSAPSFASLQTFSRQLGTAGARTQESTLVLSMGVSPFRSVPLSFSATLPASSIDTLDGAGGSRAVLHLGHLLCIGHPAKRRRLAKNRISTPARGIELTAH